MSQFLIHLIKDGNYEHFTLKPGNPPGCEKAWRTVSAKASLEEIFRNKQIEARSPFGYFRLKINMYRPFFGRSYFNGGVDPTDLYSVCSSETPLRELGGNPIFYVDSRRRDLLAALDSSLAKNQVRFTPAMHLIETYGPSVIAAGGYSDFRWEREWRKKDSLNLDFEDLAFGICPEGEIDSFTKLTQGRVTFIDPDWSEEKLRAYLEKHKPDLIAYL